MISKNAIYYLLVFLFSPIISLFLALKNPKERFSYNIIWLFTAFFGLTFAVNYFSTNDIVRYLEVFNSWKSEGRDLYYLVNNSYGIERESFKDVFFPLISLFSAKLGLSDVFFLGLLGLIFGYFYSRVYRILALEVNFNNNSIFLFILLATFLLINPIWRGINGVRFSLGAIIFVFIILKYYKTGFSFISLLAISSLFLVHFSMSFPITVFFLFYFIGKRISIKILFFLYVVSFFVSEVSLDYLNEILKMYTPDFLISKIDAYARDSVIDELGEKVKETNWYVKIFLKSLFYASSLMVFYIYRKYREIKKYNSKLVYLVKFSFLFSILVNIFNFIPSFGRMALISNTLVVYIFTLLISNIDYNSNQLTPIKLILTPMLILYLIVQIRIGFDYISIETIIGNPIGALFNLDDTPLIDLIK